MTRPEALRRIMRLRALAARPGTPEEGDTAGRAARALAEREKISEDEIAGFEKANKLGAGEIDPNDADLWAELIRVVLRANRDRGRGFHGKAPHGVDWPSATAVQDHISRPDRVHMAIDNWQAVCGVTPNTNPKKPSFVWTYTRAIALTSGMPCQHCLSVGLLDARRPELLTED
jgi:hypothetical protein